MECGIKSDELSTPLRSQFVYSILQFFCQIIENELALLQRKAAVELLAETLIPYRFF